MTELIQLSQAQTITVALAVFFTGFFAYKKYPFLEKYNISELFVGVGFTFFVLYLLSFAINFQFTADQEKKIIELTQAQTLLIAMGVFFIGTFIHGKYSLLKKYNIPEPVIGGIFASLVLSVIYLIFARSFIFDGELYDDLMMTFFATVGLSAKFSFFKKGGKNIFIFLFVAGLFLIIQNLMGVSVAKLFGLSPYIGLLAGSVTLSGGHATGAVYAKLPAFAGIPQAGEIAFACATFGLVIGGIIGGPISQLLIARHKLAPENKVLDPDDALRGHGFNEPETVTARSIIQVLLGAFVAIYCGRFLSANLNPLLVEKWGPNAQIPSFILVLAVGVIITNLCDLTKKYQVHEQSTDLINATSLTLFLSIALMSLKLWDINLSKLAFPMMTIIALQTVLMALYSYYVTFRALGRDYDAAVIAGGHCGFGLGATTTAVANIESVTNRYGAAPRAMFSILMVGAFFIDICNATVVQIFMYFF